MKLSPSIDLIWRLAADEMAAGEFSEIQPEHFAMAMLKFAEVSVKTPEESGEQAEIAKVLSEETQLIREALQKCGIEGTSARRKLRKQLGKGDAPHKGAKIHRSAASRTLFESAAALASESGSATLTPLHLLTALVQSPTPAIAQAVLGKAQTPPPLAALPLLEKHGRDLVRQAADGKIRVQRGREAQCKAVTQVLQLKERKSVLLVSNSDELVVDLANTLAGVIAATNAPAELKNRRFIDIAEKSRLDELKGMRPSREEEAEELERMRQLLAEAAAHPEVILLVPAVRTGPKEVSGARWSNLLQEALAKGKVQFICRVAPKVFTECLRKDPIWKKHTRAVWLEQLKQGSVPREL